MSGRIVGLLGGFLLWGVTGAYADPVTVMGGFVSTDFVGTTVDIVTDGFSVDLNGAQGGVFQMPANVSAGLQQGQVVDFSSSIQGAFRNLGSPFPPSVVNGIPYANAADLTAMANLQFAATPVTVTAAPGASGFPEFDLRAPFSLSGSVQVFQNAGTSANPTPGTLLLSTGVTGAGTLEIQGGGPPNSLGIDSVSATLSQAATPEPASILLLGTGIAGLVLRRWRRRG